MSANGQSFLLDPEKKTGPMRYSHARVVSPSTHHTIYISGIAAVTPDGKYEGVTENPDGYMNWTSAHKPPQFYDELRA
uniref:Uncharacterized protein n=1 Tax=Talaromyces marneffei PM1 TaxID=1077442 RepID=A0A093V3J0_TALMA